MLSSSIPSVFNIPWANSAVAPYTHAVPEASQIAITPGAASLTDGFVPINFLSPLAGGVPPFGNDMNGILNQITAWLRWNQAGGVPGYNGAFQTAISGYPLGAVVQSASVPGKFWYSSTENNVTNPDTGGAGWSLIMGTVYAPLTGVGASGTWGISISGNAATATTAAACSGNSATATNATNATGSAVVSGAVQSGTNPKFRVSRLSTQAVTTQTFTKVLFDARVFDVGNLFDITTNHRFQPNVAGYYNISYELLISSSTTTISYAYAIATKNGVGFSHGSQYGSDNTGTPVTDNCYLTGSGTVYLNGTTDYVEVGVYVKSTGAITVGGGYTYLSGELIP